MSISRGGGRAESNRVRVGEREAGNGGLQKGGRGKGGEL